MLNRHRFSAWLTSMLAGLFVLFAATATGAAANRQEALPGMSDAYAEPGHLLAQTGVPPFIFPPGTVGPAGPLGQVNPSLLQASGIFSVPFAERFPAQGWTVVDQGPDLPDRDAALAFMHTARISSSSPEYTPVLSEDATTRCVATFSGIGDSARIVYMDDGSLFAYFEVHLPEGGRYSAGILIGAATDATAEPHTIFSHMAFEEQNAQGMLSRGNRPFGLYFSGERWSEQSLTHILTEGERNPGRWVPPPFTAEALTFLWNFDFCALAPLLAGDATQIVPASETPRPPLLEFGMLPDPPPEPGLQVIRGWDALIATLQWNVNDLDVLYPIEDWTVLTGNAIPEEIQFTSPIVCYAVLPGFIQAGEYTQLENGERRLRLRFPVGQVTNFLHMTYNARGGMPFQGGQSFQFNLQSATGSRFGMNSGTAPYTRWSDSDTPYLLLWSENGLQEVGHFVSPNAYATLEIPDGPIQSLSDLSIPGLLVSRQETTQFGGGFQLQDRLLMQAANFLTETADEFCS